MTSSREQLKPVGNLTPGKVSDILWESAIEAFVQAILVVVMGSVALSIVGGLLQDMVPSIPPGFAPPFRPFPERRAIQDSVPFAEDWPASL